jgi:hypothetical protein
MVKSTLTFASTFDPTGLAGLANTFIKDSCPIFDSDKHLIKEE